MVGRCRAQSRSPGRRPSPTRTALAEYPWAGAACSYWRLARYHHGVDERHRVLRAHVLHVDRHARARGVCHAEEARARIEIVARRGREGRVAPKDVGPTAVLVPERVGHECQRRVYDRVSDHEQSGPHRSGEIFKMSTACIPLLLEDCPSDPISTAKSAPNHATAPDRAPGPATDTPVLGAALQSRIGTRVRRSVHPCHRCAAH
jgi:hypothetical protein